MAYPKINQRFLVIVVAMAIIGIGIFYWQKSNSFSQINSISEACSDSEKQYNACTNDEDCICCDQLTGSREGNICLNKYYLKKSGLGCVGIDLIGAFCEKNGCKCVGGHCTAFPNQKTECEKCLEKNLSCFSCCDLICAKYNTDCGSVIDCVQTKKYGCVNEIFITEHHLNEDEYERTENCTCANYICVEKRECIK